MVLRSRGSVIAILFMVSLFVLPFPHGNDSTRVGGYMEEAHVISLKKYADSDWLDPFRLVCAPNCTLSTIKLPIGKPSGSFCYPPAITCAALKLHSPLSNKNEGGGEPSRSRNPCLSTCIPPPVFLLIIS
jgi:hypothetical protein